jgi:hypothetical protein
MQPVLADTTYDYTKPWYNNANDRVAWEREFLQGDFERRQMAQAMITQNPFTSGEEIREKMTVRGVPSRFGYDDTQKSITDVLDVEADPHINDMHTTDFSGTASGKIATSIPSLPLW